MIAKRGIAFLHHQDQSNNNVKQPETEQELYNGARATPPNSPIAVVGDEIN